MERLVEIAANCSRHAVQSTICTAISPRLRGVGRRHTDAGISRHKINGIIAIALVALVAGPPLPAQQSKDDKPPARLRSCRPTSIPPARA